MGWLTSAASGFAVAISDGTVWLSIGQALLFARRLPRCSARLVARLVGLLEAGRTGRRRPWESGWRPALLVLAAWWAAIASGGRSSFTPVAVGFAIAIGLAVVRRARSRAERRPRAASPEVGTDAASVTSRRRRRSLVLAVLGGAVFIVAVALLYGSTLVLSPRDGVQPVEFTRRGLLLDPRRGPRQDRDRVDLPAVRVLRHRRACRPRPGTTGARCGSRRPSSRSSARRRSTLATSSSCPLILLAAAALTGTLVRRLTGSRVARRLPVRVPRLPVPRAGPAHPRPVLQLAGGRLDLRHHHLRPGRRRGPARDVRPRRARRRRATWALAAFVGSAAALILPAHIAIAAARAGRGRERLGRPHRRSPSSRRGRLPDRDAGLATDLRGDRHRARRHRRVGAPHRARDDERRAVAERVPVQRVLARIRRDHRAGRPAPSLAIAVAWFLVRQETSIQNGLYLGTIALLVAGALVLGLAARRLQHVPRVLRRARHLRDAGRRRRGRGRSGCGCAPPATCDWPSPSWCSASCRSSSA